MSYFKEVSAYQTYRGQSEDFHFSYNENSGGGQAFLGGVFSDETGNLHPANYLDGTTASFCFPYVDVAGNTRYVDLSDPSMCYRIAPRAQGDNNVKLVIADNGVKKITPSKGIATFLMLPEPCGVRNPMSPSLSVLGNENFWLQSMWLTVRNASSATPVFIPKDCVLAGGSNIAGHRKERYFAVDFGKRIADVIAMAEESQSLSPNIANVITLFAAIYKGEKSFSYVECAGAIKDLMASLTEAFPDKYSGLLDPLTFLRDNMSLNTPQQSSEAISNLQRIVYGAPGTGKSHRINDDVAKTPHTRVTFHPDYSFSAFFGAYRPQDEGGRITYKFAPGPFMIAYRQALQKPDESHVLVIEELNRANAPAVFGDVFQLLDRDASGASQFPVAAPIEVKSWLESDDPVYGSKISHDCSLLKLPPNFCIWATMNPADQGVFPLDTAFKRRWRFEYIGINDEESNLLSIPDCVAASRWNTYRKAINQGLLSVNINEDKLLGPFFLSPSELKTEEAFNEAFEDKVIMYLFEDAARFHRKDLFKKDYKLLSELRNDYKVSGFSIFAPSIQTQTTPSVAQTSNSTIE